MHKIEMPFNSLPTRKVIECKECYLILLPEHIEYRIVAEYDLDEGGIWVNKKANYRWLRERGSLTGVEMFFDNDSTTWDVGVLFNEYNAAWAFDDSVLAYDVYKQLKEYFKTKTTI